MDVVGEIIRACDVILGDYDDALNGYEFISLFHPDPNIRLIASWDYEEVEALINSGNGGGERQFQVTSYKLKSYGKRKSFKEWKMLSKMILCYER